MNKIFNRAYDPYNEIEPMTFGYVKGNSCYPNSFSDDLDRYTEEARTALLRGEEVAVCEDEDGEIVYYYLEG